MRKEPTDELMTTLGLIAFFKSTLPFELRGWVNELDLYVQERRAGHLTRLQAGGKFRNYLDAWKDADSDWDIRKFDSKTWARRFDRLVKPTYEIAEFLSDCAAAYGGVPEHEASALLQAISQFQSGGEWPGLPSVDVGAHLADRQDEAQQRKVEETIRSEEAWAKKDPTHPGPWSLLPVLYERTGRYKDAEHALQRASELQRARFPDNDGADWSDRIQLGKLYFSAFSNAVRGRGVPVWGYEASGVTPDSLGYSTEQIAVLAKESLSRGCQLALDAGFKETHGRLRQAALALHAIDQPFDPQFESYDKFDPER